MATTSPQQFTRFVEPHIEVLRRAAYRMCRNVADAEDLVQEVCLRAFERFPGAREVEAPRAWLLRVQFHLHVDAVRRQGASRPEPFDEPRHSSLETAAQADGPDDDAEAALLIEALGTAWPSLNRDQQALLALYAEGYRLSEIAEITGLPLSALKARLRRARVRLGKLMHVDGRPQNVAAISGERS